MYYENISAKFMHELDSKEKYILEVLLDGTSKMLMALIIFHSALITLML